MCMTLDMKNQPTPFESMTNRVQRRYLAFCVTVCIHADLIAQEALLPPLQKPNIILIVADDLGFGEVGYYGQQRIKTPRIDEMASKGIAFSQFYAGATVCAPSRCTLITGRHNGHATVRGNAQPNNTIIQSLLAEDFTVAEMLKSRGYDTACIGKWGLGELGEPGHPLQQGFDHFFGYLNQVHAHNYYPGFLFDDAKPLTLRNVVELAAPERGDIGGGYAKTKLDYAPELCINKATDFITRPRSSPFFLYFATTLPHSNNEAARMIDDGSEVPNTLEYDDQSWPTPNKKHAAMVTYLDSMVGRLVDQLKRLGIDDETMIIFTSDNGPHKESKHVAEFFEPSGPLRGMKRDLYEGGIRVPMICSWPGRIAEGDTSEHIGYSGDIFATLADLTGGPVDVTDGPIDSRSFAPTLISGFGPQTQHEYLYFEFLEQGSRQAVRFGDWKLIREPMFTGQVQLYNLKEDLAESKDVAKLHPMIVNRGVRYMDAAHVPSDRWPSPAEKTK
jgi:arylsulfatase A-like enzyme